MKTNISVHYGPARTVVSIDGVTHEAHKTLAQALNQVDDLRESLVADEPNMDVTVTVDAQIWDELMLAFLAHNKNQ